MESGLIIPPALIRTGAAKEGTSSWYPYPPFTGVVPLNVLGIRGFLNQSHYDFEN